MSKAGDHPGVQSYLLPQERLVAEVRWHFVWLLRPILISLGALLGIFTVVRILPAWGDDSLGYFVFLFLPVGYFIWKWLDWWCERLVVTDRRLLMISGVLSRKVAVMPLRKVTDLTFKRPLIGRMFARYGWGTFIFESAGQDQALRRIPFVPRPRLLFHLLSDEIFGEFGISGRKPRPDVATSRATRESPGSGRRDDED